jgi:hypothetical protein
MNNMGISQYFRNIPTKTKIISVAVIVVVGLCGIASMVIRASGFFAAADPENGTLSGNASIVSDATASGGKVIRFNAPAPAPAPAPSPPPPPGSTSCPLPAYPDASCTGIPAGTSLTLINGDMTISTPNTVIDSKEIHGCVTVTAPGVIIRKSKIYCTSASPDVVSSPDGAYDGTALLVEDSDVSCSSTPNNVASGGPGTAFGDTHIVVHRTNIHGCENGFDIDADVTVTDSYIHDLWNSADSHTDGIQFASGHYVSASNHSIINGALNVTITHNTIFSRGYDGTDTTSAIISNRGGDNTVLIQANLLAGGAYTLYCEQNATGTNYRVINNHFSTKYHPTVGAYGMSTDCSDEVQSGNVVHETGQAVTLE